MSGHYLMFRKNFHVAHWESRKLPSHIRDTGHMDFKLQEYWGNVNFNVGHT